MIKGIRRRAGVAALSALTAASTAGLLPLASSAGALQGFAFERLAGANRYETAADIAAETFPSGATTAVLARDALAAPDADALGGNYVAGVNNAPILVTPTNSLHAATEAALADLGVDNVIIMGGTAAISQAVEDDLESQGYNVTRVAGANRYATAAQAASQGTPATVDGDVAAFLASSNPGQNVTPDALSVGPVSYAGPIPVFLTTTNTTPTETLNGLQAEGIEHIYILGGTNVVTQAQEDALKAAGYETTRLAGANRGETSMAIAEEFAAAKLGWNFDHLNLARGDDAADALAGGPHGGEEQAPLIITIGTCTVDDDTEAFFAEHANELTDGHIYGGTAAVCEDVESDLEAAGGQTPSNQQFTVAGATETRQTGAAGDRTCAATVPAGTVVDAVVLPTQNVTQQAGGDTAFADADNDNLADLGAPTAQIVAVNGAPVTPAQQFNNITSGGTINVTIRGTSPEDVTLLVYSDQAGLTADRLDLAVESGASSEPREPFGVGCRTIFANEAASGAIATTVAQASKDADVFSGTNSFSYFYDSNDVFQLGVACTQVTMAVFETALSPGDGVTGTYNADPQFPSTFCLDDAAPDAPANAATTVSGTTVTVRFDESDTSTADSYNVYRIVRPPSGTCPDFNTTAGRAAFGTAVGTVADPSTTTDTNRTIGGGNPLTFTDANLAQNTNYCYAVTTVDDGDESNDGAVATALTGSTTDTGAPRITDVRASDAGTVGVVDSGDLHQFIFSEPMATTVDDAGQLYRIQDSDGTVAEITCGTNASCVLQPAGTFNGVAQQQYQVMRVSITGAVTPIPGFLGTLPGVQYPATVTNVSAGWDDAAGNQLDLAGSPDKVINVDTITPTPAADATAPAMSSAVADESADTVTITYSEAVSCPSTAVSQFTYTDTDDAGTAAASVVCNGTTVTLTFADGVIQVADGAANVIYNDDNDAAVDANDVRDGAGNPAADQTQAATVQA